MCLHHNAQAPLCQAPDQTLPSWGFCLIISHPCAGPGTRPGIPDEQEGAHGQREGALPPSRHPRSAEALGERQEASLLAPDIGGWGGCCTSWSWSPWNTTPSTVSEKGPNTTASAQHPRLSGKILPSPKMTSFCCYSENKRRVCPQILSHHLSCWLQFS